MTEESPTSVLAAKRAAQHVRLSPANDAYEHLCILTLLSSLALLHLMLADTSLPRGSDAALASVGTLFEGFERFVASPPYLVGYVRRDARFDQYLLVKQSFPTAFRSHGDKPVGGAEIRPSVSGTIQH